MLKIYTYTSICVCVLCSKVLNEECDSDIQIRRSNSKPSPPLYFILSYFRSNSLGQWKGGEWTEVGNRNRENNGEGAPQRPSGSCSRSGCAFAGEGERPNATLVFLPLFFTWEVKPETQIIITIKKGKDSRITNNHTQSLQTYSETTEYTLKSSKNNKNPVIVKKESIRCNKGSQ